jgi:tight adherence protein B
MLSALAAAIAVLAAWDTADHRLLRRFAGTPPAAGGRRGAPGGWAVAVGLGALIVLGGAVDGRRGTTLACAAGIAGWAAWLLRRQARARRRTADARAEVAKAGEALAGLLRVGAIPTVALSMVAADHPVLAEAAAEFEVAGDVVVALRRGAAGAGLDGLDHLAAAWEVASRSGASMESSIDAIATELRRRHEAGTTVRVELAASRSAGRLLAVLPLAGLLLAYGFGGDPLTFLTQNPVGEVCLVLAVACTSVGLIWTDALADRAAR